MNIIEICSNRRSGHHLFLSWLISNLTGEIDNKTSKLNKITWLNKEVCHFNDATYHAFFNREGVLEEINQIINNNPKFLFMNYEEGDVINGVNNEGTSIWDNNPTKVIFIRDFLNTMASKWVLASTNMSQFYFGFEREREILENIEYWKKMARWYLSGEYAAFKYEDLLLSKEKREVFLEKNFGVKETFDISQVNGTLPSFPSKNYNERYKEIEFSDLFKRLVCEDDELNELITQLKYNEPRRIYNT